MNFRMFKTYIKLFIWKIENKIKYGEDIFPLWEEPQPYKRVDNIDTIIERLG